MFRFGLLLAGLLPALSAFAQSTAPVRPTERPFLWRIEGPVPSYLYGTVHVPDPRVLELPEVVRRALDSSDVFAGEIPLDAGTQLGLIGRVMLPPGQDLKTIAGEDVYNRIVRVVEKAMGPVMGQMMAGVMATMKPWAVMSQLELLDFLPDVAAGREPLDAALYSTAEKAGKELGALETVEEQIGVFEAFSVKEQVQMLVEALDELEKPHADSASPVQQLIGLYLAGDLEKLAAEANDQSQAGDAALNKKMTTRVVDERNTKMSAKIAELCARKPAKSHFFAVGALHFAGETGILRQLEKKGLKITRLGPNDASSIGRKPAA